MATVPSFRAFTELYCYSLELEQECPPPLALSNIYVLRKQQPFFISHFHPCLFHTMETRTSHIQAYLVEDRAPEATML